MPSEAQRQINPARGEITPHQAAGKTHHKKRHDAESYGIYRPGILAPFYSFNSVACSPPVRSLRVTDYMTWVPLTWPIHLRHRLGMTHVSPVVTIYQFSLSCSSFCSPFFSSLSLCFSLQHIFKHITAHIGTHIHTYSLFPLPFSLCIFWNELNAELGQNIKRWRCESWHLSEV